MCTVITEPELFLLPGNCRLNPDELVLVYLHAPCASLRLPALNPLLLLLILVLFLVSSSLPVPVHFRLLHEDSLQRLLLLEHVLTEFDVQGCSSVGLNMRFQEAD